MSCEGEHGGQMLTDIVTAVGVYVVTVAGFAGLVFALRCAWRAAG